jgi:hypothetical protein
MRLPIFVSATVVILCAIRLLSSLTVLARFYRQPDGKARWSAREALHRGRVPVESFPRTVPCPVRGIPLQTHGVSWLRNWPATLSSRSIERFLVT